MAARFLKLAALWFLLKIDAWPGLGLETGRKGREIPLSPSIFPSGGRKETGLEMKKLIKRAHSQIKAHLHLLKNERCAQ
jgi:hypothetical protein